MITAILADDHEIVRQSLGSLLDRSDDIKIVAEAGDGREAVELAIEHRPNVVVMDITMPVMDGIKATRQILATVDDVKIIALSATGYRNVVEKMLDAGASGYVLKEGAFKELCDAIRGVAEGQIYLSPSITGIDVDTLRMKGTRESLCTKLTSCQKTVLQLLAEGKSNNEVADILSVRMQTVHWHRHSLMEKLGLSSMAGLTKYALREGLTTL